MKQKLLVTLLLFATFAAANSLNAQSFDNERIYNAYLKIQEATAEGKYEEALAGINKLAGYRTTPIENAAILRARGYILLNLDREMETVRDFQTALGLNVLNNQMEQEMRYVIANLLASNEQWKDAFDIYKEWIEFAKSETAKQEGLPEPDEDAYSLGAAIASSCGDFDFAIDCTEQALLISKEPQRELYNLLIALHFQAKNFKEAVHSLQRALAHFPNDEEFWKNLSGIYQMIKEDKEALAALVIAYDEGMMEEEEEFLLLGRFYLYNEMPFNGAETISTGMERDIVSKSKDNLELLSQAWFQAREYDKSLETLKELVRKTGDEDATLRASQILIDQEKHKEALEMLEIGLANGKIKDLGTLYKLQGYAYYGLREYAKAVEAFTLAASADPEEKSSYDQWVDYLKSEYLVQAN